MRYKYTPSEQEFRDKVSTWLSENLPKSWPDESDFEARAKADSEWQKCLYEAGYAGLAWPKAYGGAGLSPIEELIFQLELANAGAPSVDTRMVGLGHAGPTLIAAGSKAQQSKFLPPILKGEAIWSQGFSEPNAGSDLAALRTMAVIEGDELVVNGQKTWSSWAQVSDVQELLVRTDRDASRHKGISWVICDMKTPGISVRPIKTITKASHFCEVFYDNVRIPLENVVGGLHNGWHTAMVTLSFERGTHFIATQIAQKGAIQALIRRAAGLPSTIDRAFISRKLAILAIEAEALLAMSYRTVSDVQKNSKAGPSASMMKILTVDLLQKVAEVGLEMAGKDGLIEGDELTHEWLMQYAFIFGGGTPEIQRNVIAERLLGMPR